MASSSPDSTAACIRPYSGPSWSRMAPGQNPTVPEAMYRSRSATGTAPDREPGRRRGRGWLEVPTVQDADVVARVAQRYDEVDVAVLDLRHGRDKGAARRVGRSDRERAGQRRGVVVGS